MPTIYHPYSLKGKCKWLLRLLPQLRSALEHDDRVAVEFHFANASGAAKNIVREARALGYSGDLKPLLLLCRGECGRWVRNDVVLLVDDLWEFCNGKIAAEANQPKGGRFTGKTTAVEVMRTMERAVRAMKGKWPGYSHFKHAKGTMQKAVKMSAYLTARFAESKSPRRPKAVTFSGAVEARGGSLRETNAEIDRLAKEQDADNRQRRIHKRV